MKCAYIFTWLTVAGCSMVVANAAEQAADPTVKLRESLRNTMVQLRTEQAERATLQAAQAESEAKLKELTAKVESLTKQAATEQSASRKALEEANASAENRAKQIVRLEETLDKWKDGYNKAATLAQEKETARAQLAQESIAQKRTIADQKAKNVALYDLACEILTRYEKFGLGEAVKAREPFTGITRARLETLVQDYQDKVADQRIRDNDSKTKKP